MQHISRVAFSALAVITVAIIVGLTACEETESPLVTKAAEAVKPPSTPIRIPGLAPHQQLARLIALGLQDPEVRNALDHAMDNSPIDENKLHLQTYLRSSGTSLLHTMAQLGGVSTARINELLQTVGSFEIYLPVDAQRKQWEGGSNVVVATVLDDGPNDRPVGFDLSGKYVELSATTPPEVPTISVVPAEAFDDEGVPYGRTDRRVQRLSIPTPRFDHDTKTQFTGAWITEIHTDSDWESWTLGDAEFVLYLLGVEDSRATYVCANEDENAEPFLIDFDGGDFYYDLLIVPRNVPEHAKMVIAFYEDDDERCVIKDDKDYIKEAADAIVATADAIEPVVELVQLDYKEFGLDILSATFEVWDLIQSSDEFVGLVAPDHKIDGVERTFYAVDQHLNKTVRLKMVWDTRAPE